MELTRAQLEAILEQALREYPEECCGLLLGPVGAGAEALEVRPCRNIQNEMHQRDPERYPRTARRAYLLDLQTVQRALRDAREDGRVIRAVYHSHPDEDAYFSAEDRAAAVPFGDVPSFPEADYLVVSVRKGEPGELKAFRWDREKRDYGEVPLRVVEG
ncbi:MAG: Mov34/MPN/PAD-1 family protein [Nitrospinota bacterium]